MINMHMVIFFNFSLFAGLIGIQARLSQEIARGTFLSQVRWSDNDPLIGGSGGSGDTNRSGDHIELGLRRVSDETLDGDGKGRGEHVGGGHRGYGQAPGK